MIGVEMHRPEQAELQDFHDFCVVTIKDGDGGKISIFLNGAESIPAARAMVEYFNDFIMSPPITAPRAGR